MSQKMKFYIILAFLFVVSYFGASNSKLIYKNETDVTYSFKQINQSEVNSAVSKVPRYLTLLGTTLDGKTVLVGLQKMSWQDARERCKEDNYRLLSVSSFYQQDFIMTSAPNDEYWTSAREHREKSGFQWDDIANSRPKHMINWRTFGEDAFPYKLCATITRRLGHSDNGIMTSRQCTDQMKFLCEA